jgi:hypothetical protein
MARLEIGLDAWMSEFVDSVGVGGDQRFIEMGGGWGLQAPATNHELLITNHQSPVTTHEPPRYWKTLTVPSSEVAPVEYTSW